jgi:hypothetical protein
MPAVSLLVRPHPRAVRATFAASARFEGLSLERLELFDGENRIWKQFERDGDARAFGARWAAFPRALVLPTLAEALTGASDARRVHGSTGVRPGRAPGGATAARFDAAGPDGHRDAPAALMRPAP